MQKKKQNELQLPLSVNCKLYCITWNDERWTASKEDLKIINAILRSNEKPSKSLFRRVINMIFFPKHVMKWIMKSGFGS